MIDKLKAAQDALLAASLNFDGNVEENNAAITAAKAELEAANESIEAQLAAAGTATEQVSTLTAENEQLKADLEAKEVDATGASEAIETLTAELESKGQEVTELSEQLAALNTEVADLKTANAKLAKETETAKADLANSQNIPQPVNGGAAALDTIWGHTKK